MAGHVSKKLSLADTCRGVCSITYTRDAAFFARSMGCLSATACKKVGRFSYDGERSTLIGGEPTRQFQTVSSLVMANVSESPPVAAITSANNSFRCKPSREPHPHRSLSRRTAMECELPVPNRLAPSNITPQRIALSPYPCVPSGPLRFPTVPMTAPSRRR